MRSTLRSPDEQASGPATVLRAVLAAGLVALVGIAPGAAAPAAAEDAGPAPPTERRAALEARFDAEEAACRARFAVNACVDAVRQRRREALAPLREQELQVRARQREVRAAERRAALAQRQAQAASAAAGALPRAWDGPEAASASARTAPRPAALAASGPPLREAIRGADRELTRQLEQAQRAQQAARRSAAAQRRRDQAQHTQVRIREREAARADRPPDPLPAPAAAAAPAPAASGPAR